MPTIRLYHGTSHEFDAFDNRFAMRGVEPNSALGIHLTECPFLAAEYADLSMRADTHAVRPTVLVLDVTIEKTLLISSVDDFLGRPHDIPLGEPGCRTHSDFTESRLTLEHLGFDAVCLDSQIDDLVGTWVIFDASRIKIIDQVSPQSVYSDETLDRSYEWQKVDIVSGCLFDAGPIPLTA